MRSLFPDSVHGKLLNHRRCGSPEDEEQESKTKESVKKKKDQCMSSLHHLSICAAQSYAM